MAANEPRIFQTMKEANPLIYSTFLDIAANKLLAEQGISSRILNASNSDFLAWLKSAVSLAELNQAILERNTLPEGITQSDYIAFVNRPDRDKIVNYLLNDPVKREALHATGEVLAAGIAGAMVTDLKLSLETVQKIIALCSSGNTSYIAPISEQQYQEWLDNNIKSAISTVKNDVYYLTAQKDIDILTNSIDSTFSPVIELKKGIAKIIRVIEFATYNLAPSLWNKDIQFVAGNVSKVNTLPPLLYEYYSMLTALHRSDMAPEEFIAIFNQKVSPFLGKLLQQKREEENSLFSKYNLSSHYTWHLRGLDFLLTIPKLASRTSALSEKRKSVIINDEKAAELASDLSVGDEEEFLEKLISHLMETRSLSREDAEKRAKLAFEESEREQSQKEKEPSLETSSSSSSTPPPPPPPLPPAARFKLKAATTLRIALGKEASEELVNTMISRGVNQKAIRTALDQMEKKKESAPKAQEIPAATKYGPLEISKVQEPATVYIFSHLPPQEELAKLKSGYLLVKDVKLVKTRLYYVSPKDLVECRSDNPDALKSLCAHLDQSLDKDQLLAQLTTFFMATPFNLSLEEAEKRATTVLEKENAPEGFLSSSLSSAAPLSSEAEFKLRLKNSLRSNIEHDAKDAKTAANLVDTFMATAGLKCVTLDPKQHRELILQKCGGHNYRAAESAVPVAESSSSRTQGPMAAPAPMVASVERRPSLGVSQNTPAPMGSVERKPSLSSSQSAPSKEYNLDGYGITLDWPADVDIIANMLYYKWDAEKSELTAKFKQGDAAPVHLLMKITDPRNIRLLNEAFGNPTDTISEKLKEFLKFRTEKPNMGPRGSMAFRKPPIQAPENDGRRSVSPDKDKGAAEDSSKEKHTPEREKGVVDDNPKEKESVESKQDAVGEIAKLSTSPSVSFLPPVKETPADPTPPNGSSIRLSNSQD